MRLRLTGGPFTPGSFFALLRTVAWKGNYYAEDLSNLGPRYNCARCDLPEKDLKRGCPACPLSEAFNLFKSEVEEEAARLGGFGEWTFERLYRIHNEAVRLLADNKGRINPKWDATLAECCRVVRGEQQQAEYVRLWNQRKAG